MNIEFEELPFTLGGVDVFPLAGNFDVEADGSIGTIWLEEWNAPRNRKPKMIMLDGQSQGLSRLFWLLLQPMFQFVLYFLVFGVIFAAGADDPLDDLATLAKANPSLGDTVFVDYLQIGRAHV